MSTIKVVSMTGAEVGSVELNDAIFGIEPNMSVVHEVVKNHLANCRQGTQSALTRAEVSGGGRKPWRQKGTGRARSFLSAVKADGKAAVITPEVNEVVVKSARNLPGVTTAPAKLINVYDLLNAKTLVIDKEALAVIEEVFA